MMFLSVNDNRDHFLSPYGLFIIRVVAKSKTTFDGSIVSGFSPFTIHYKGASCELVFVLRFELDLNFSARREMWLENLKHSGIPGCNLLTNVMLS